MTCYSCLHKLKQHNYQKVMYQNIKWCNPNFFISCQLLPTIKDAHFSCITCQCLSINLNYDMLYVQMNYIRSKNYKHKIFSFPEKAKQIELLRDHVKLYHVMSKYIDDVVRYLSILQLLPYLHYTSLRQYPLLQQDAQVSHIACLCLRINLKL